MRKTNKFIFSLWCLLIAALLFTNSTTGQKRKSTGKKKKENIVVITSVPMVIEGTAGGSLSNNGEPYLSLEPCAKETPEQISELENAPDADAQVEILLKRVNEKDDWLRSCAIYRLGEFHDKAQDALPVIIRLLRDEENKDVWRHVETALWKIPPGQNTPLREKIELSKNENVYIKIYGVYSLGYSRPVAGSFQAKDTLDALIAAAKDEDVTVSWLAVMGIRELGFNGINTAAAIPVLSELLKNSKINPLHPVRAFVPMGENALPAAPLLFDVLYNPKKYVGEDKDNTLSYALYATTAIALSRIGKPLLPLLEKEIVKEPFGVLQIIGNMGDPGVLPIIYQAMKNENPKVREKAIESLPSLTSIGAVEVLPHLLNAIRDPSLGVRKAAMNAIGSIGSIKEKSGELQNLLKTKIFPALIANLKDKELNCYASLTLGYFGTEAAPAIPALVNLIKKGKGDYCAESALYDIGEKGRKFLTEERIKNIESSRKITQQTFDSNYNKAKPIKPKTQPSVSPTPLKKEG
jgi:HEAT repeat protein